MENTVHLVVRRPCSDFMDMLRRLISCRIIIIIGLNNISAARLTVTVHQLSDCTFTVTPESQQLRLL